MFYFGKIGHFCKNVRTVQVSNFWHTSAVLGALNLSRAIATHHILRGMCKSCFTAKEWVYSHVSKLCEAVLTGNSHFWMIQKPEPVTNCHSLPMDSCIHTKQTNSKGAQLKLHRKVGKDSGLNVDLVELQPCKTGVSGGGDVGYVKKQLSSWCRICKYAAQHSPRTPHSQSLATARYFVSICVNAALGTALLLEYEHESKTHELTKVLTLYALEETRSWITSILLSGPKGN